MKNKIVGYIRADTKILLKRPKNLDRYIRLYINLEPINIKQDFRKLIRHGGKS